MSIPKWTKLNIYCTKISIALDFWFFVRYNNGWNTYFKFYNYYYRKLRKEK
jgi:hypothetical protein